VSSSRITYAPRPDATPEAELPVLAAVYKICLESHAKKNAAGMTSTNGDDAMKGSKNDRAKTIIQESR
jgi:hypothetical protein